MNKNRIRLTESDLHRIVKESVERILNEHKPLYTNGDVETAKLGSDSYDGYVYHYDNNGNKVIHNWKTDIGDKHNKRTWKHIPQRTDLQRDTEELLPMLRSLGISVKDWRRMSSEEKQKIVNNYEGFNDPYRVVKESVNRILKEDDYMDVKYNDTVSKLRQYLSQISKLITEYENEFGQDAINFDVFLSTVQSFIKQLNTEQL